MDESFEGRIAALLAATVDDFGALTACRQLTAGASQETWRIDYTGSAGDDRVALRRRPPGLADDAGPGGITPETEARLLQLAQSGGVPVPRVLGVLTPAHALGEGFLMQWLEGETLGQRITRAPELAALRTHLARDLGEILARIHALDWRAAGLEGALPVAEPGALVEDTFRLYRELDVPQPMIDFTWRWLREHLPAPSGNALVHGDFRNGNFMVTPAGVRAVLDWELAHVGDPLRDLGWLCVNSWRFGGEATVGGFGTLEDLLAGYEGVAGRTVDRGVLHFWQIFGSFWWAVVTLHMASTWRSGATPSLERPVIGRRSSEAQMDCVNLLIPGAFRLPDADRPLDAGTRLPMAAELTDSVARFLREEVAGELDAHRGFLARVGVNALGIVRRELQYGIKLEAAEASRLRRLVCSPSSLDNMRRDLSRRLREGLPLQTPGLANHLRQTVAGQLFVDQPHYSALAGPR